jgi:hypothetical protein
MKIQICNLPFLHRYLSVSDASEEWQSGGEKEDDIYFKLKLSSAPMHLPLDVLIGGLERYGPNFTAYIGFGFEDFPENYGERIREEFKDSWDECHGSRLRGYILDSGKDRAFTVAKQDKLLLLIMGTAGSRPRQLIENGEPLPIENFARHLAEMQGVGNRMLKLFYNGEPPNNLLYLNPEIYHPQD